MLSESHLTTLDKVCFQHEMPRWSSGQLGAYRANLPLLAENCNLIHQDSMTLESTNISAVPNSLLTVHSS